MKKIGFLINPIAGMGGAVGLKGTDNMVEEAVRRGAEPVAGNRAESMLQTLKERRVDALFLTCSDEMGEKALKQHDFGHEVIYNVPDKKTTSEDTRNACKQFQKESADLIVFCGGDGTARDVYGAVGDEMPILGIPSGVKMHSAVFAINPGSAAELIVDFVLDMVDVRAAEVMDTDEDKYRANQLDTRLFGYAKTPYKPALVQGYKVSFYGETEEQSKSRIAQFASEFMCDDSMYVLGAGTTLKSVADKLDVEKTLLGVDVVKDQKLIASDVNERQLLQLLDKHPKARILITPIGAQGFILGRGTQQISPQVIRKVGVENIIVLATPYKLSQTPVLLVDTGDKELDQQLGGYISVITGYRMAQRKEVKCGV